MLRSSGHQELLDACAKEDAELISDALKQYKDLDTPDSSGRTLLMATCENGSIGMVRELLLYKADPNVRDRDGVGALDLAIRHADRPEIVKRLLEFHAHPDVPDSAGMTPLMRVCESDAPQLATMLLSAGACPGRTNAAGQSALTIASNRAIDGGASPLSQLLTAHAQQLSSEPPLLQKRVVLRGLSGRPELNGRRGTAVSYGVASGRYGVQLDGKARERVALRPSNLVASVECRSISPPLDWEDEPRNDAPKTSVLSANDPRGVMAMARPAAARGDATVAAKPDASSIDAGGICEAPSSPVLERQPVPSGSHAAGHEPGEHAEVSLDQADDEPPGSPWLEQQPRSPNAFRSCAPAQPPQEEDAAPVTSSSALHESSKGHSHHRAESQERGDDLGSEGRPTASSPSSSPTSSMSPSSPPNGPANPAAVESVPSSRLENSPSHRHPNDESTDGLGFLRLPGTSAHLDASTYNDVHSVIAWLRMGADINAPIDPTGSTILMNAAYTGHREMMEVLLERSAEVDVLKASDGCSALLCAIQGCACRATEDDPNWRESAATQPRDLWPIRRLLDAAADPNLVCAKALQYAITPLLFATQLGASSVIEMLLSAKATPDHSSSIVPKPLMVAVANCDVRIARLLLQGGAQTEPSDVGSTAMTVACELGDGAVNLVEALLESRASPDRADACGNTPLMWACEANSSTVAELLLDAGACPRRVNAAGDAALNIAIKHANGDTPLVELLKRYTAMVAPPLLQRRVVLRGLSGRPELNGRRGTAVSFDSTTGRYGVQLDGKGKERVALRPATLRPLSEHQEDAVSHRAIAVDDAQNAPLNASGMAAAGTTLGSSAGDDSSAPLAGGERDNYENHAGAEQDVAGADALDGDDVADASASCSAQNGSALPSSPSVCDVGERAAERIDESSAQGGACTEAGMGRSGKKRSPRTSSSGSSSSSPSMRHWQHRPGELSVTFEDGAASASPRSRRVNGGAIAFDAQHSAQGNIVGMVGEQRDAGCGATEHSPQGGVSWSLVGGRTVVSNQLDRKALLDLIRLSSERSAVPNSQQGCNSQAAQRCAARTDAWIESANRVVCEQRLSSSVVGQRASLACLSEGSQLANELVQKLAEATILRDGAEERAFLESQRAEAEEKAAREAESHVVAALQQSAAQAQARQAAEKSLARIVGELEDEREKSREVEEKTMSRVEPEVHARLMHDLRSANEAAQKAKAAEIQAAVTYGAMEAALKAELTRLEAGLAQAAKRGAKDGSALRDAQDLLAAERKARAADAKQLTAQLAGARAAEASALQAARKEEEGRKAVQVILDHELEVRLPAYLEEVRRNADEKVRESEEKSASLEIMRAELAEKNKDLEDLCDRSAELLMSVRSQLEAETTSRQVAEEAVAARSAELEELEAVRRQEHASFLAREADDAAAKQAAEERSLAAAAQMAETQERLAARGAEKEQLSKYRERYEHETAKRKKVEAELKTARDSLKAAEAERTAVKAKLERFERRLQEEQGARSTAESSIAELRREQLRHKEALVQAVSKERDAKSTAVKKVRAQAEEQVAAERARVERLRQTKEATEHKLHEAAAEAAQTRAETRAELESSQERCAVLEDEIRLLQENSAQALSLAESASETQFAKLRSEMLEIEARLVQMQHDADEQTARDRRRAEDAESRARAANDTARSAAESSRELEGRLREALMARDAAEEAAAAASRQLAQRTEELTAAIAAAQASTQAVRRPQAPDPVSVSSTPMVLQYDALSDATSGFDGANVVGTGGFGVVYRASPVGPVADSGPCAVKLLSASNRQGQAEMLREVQLLGTTRHEALMPLIGFCLDTRGQCLVYPLMVGGNLEDRLLLTPDGVERLARLGHTQPPSPLTWLQRLYIMRQVVGALVFLHTPTPGKGVELHNDIKPSNILLDADLNAKLGDVGLGLPVEGSSQGRTHVSLNGVFGTTGFIDPLLSDTQRCSPVTDGYAVGIALLMCLTGLPALDIKARCRRLLCRPDEPAEWEAPGLPDPQAGAWPGRVARIVARIISGLVMAQFKEDRLPLPAAMAQMDEALSVAPEDQVPAGPARMGPIDPPAPSEERECVICMSEPREVRFSCGHAVCCRGCAESLLALGHPCPTCRTSDISAADIGALGTQPTFVQQRRPVMRQQLPTAMTFAMGGGAHGEASARYNAAASTLPALFAMRAPELHSPLSRGQPQQPPQGMLPPAAQTEPQSALPSATTPFGRALGAHRAHRGEPQGALSLPSDMEASFEPGDFEGGLDGNAFGNGSTYVMQWPEPVDTTYDDAPQLQPLPSTWIDSASNNAALDEALEATPSYDPSPSYDRSHEGLRETRSNERHAAPPAADSVQHSTRTGRRRRRGRPSAP